MADGKRRDQWVHTSALLAFIHNSNPYVKRVVMPDQLNPYMKSSGEKSGSVRITIKDLKRLVPAKG